MIKEKTLLHHYLLFYFENQEEGKYSLLYGTKVIISLAPLWGSLLL